MRFPIVMDDPQIKFAWFDNYSWLCAFPTVGPSLLGLGAGVIFFDNLIIITP